MQRSDRRLIISEINPKSPISEAYRTLRTNIQFSAIDEDLRVIVITSAGPGEGKSTTASNLAVVSAQAEKKVLLIDADLRKPTAHRTFLLTNRIGLTNYLTGQAGVDEVVRSSFVPNLDVLTAGSSPPNPSEMLGSRKMLSLVEHLKQFYDMIIIDTPPALVVTDAQIVSTYSDGVVLVIDSGKVKREAALKVKSSLEHVKARLLGVVLNNIDRKTSENYYYYYYYGNQADQK
ncbi:MAG: CpsD/CapB family tyrosine-protein kinase [Cohnella sp.]|nr:CpsD/CapB family tyrosine-protein kinase [Cohnella sp.]